MEEDDYYDEEEDKRRYEEAQAWDGLMNAWETAGFEH